MDVGYHLHGVYTTDLVTQESLRVIKNHNATQPLFLYVAHAAVHSGNPYNPLPAPDDAVSKVQHIQDYNRRKYAGEIEIGISEKKNVIKVFGTASIVGVKHSWFLFIIECSILPFALSRAYVLE